MPTLFLKPDALKIQYRALPGKKVAGFLLGLASEFDQTQAPPLRDGSLHRKNTNAHAQFKERRHSEPEFAARIHSGRKVAKRLVLLANAASAKKRTALIETTRLVLRALGFHYVLVSTYRLTRNDVTRIYQFADPHVKKKLVRYMSRRSIVIFSMKGPQSVAALQAFKTYLRHHFLHKRVDRFVLKNLIHVCSARDARIVASLILRD